MCEEFGVEDLYGEEGFGELIFAIHMENITNGAQRHLIAWDRRVGQLPEATSDDG
jgi:hypothetical protein